MIATKTESQTKPIDIELINDYITKFKIAFNSINEFLPSSLTIQTSKAIATIAENIKAIKEKQYKPILTNSNLHQQYYCLLLSIVYEQFLNTSLNKVSQITDEETLLEDIIETHYQNDR